MLECAIVTQAAYEASEDQMATTPVEPLHIKWKAMCRVPS